MSAQLPIPAADSPASDSHRGWVITWDYGFYTATSPDYDASWEGEEDGWVDNGQRVTARTRDGVISEIDNWFEENPAADTQEYQPLVWQITVDELGYQAIHETDEGGRPGDLVAEVFGDGAELIVNAPRLRRALLQLLTIAGTPVTDRQEAVFTEVRAVLRDTGAYDPLPAQSPA